MRPFRNIADAIKNKIATRKWVVQFVRRVLSKLHLSGEGIDFVEEGDGKIHLRVKSVAGGASSTHPFKVSGTAGVFTVQPGGVTTYDGIGTVLQFIPTAPLGLPLASYVWTLSAGFSGYVVLRVKFDAETGGAITDVPWTVYFIEALASLENIPIIRYNGENDPQNGELSIIIADVVNGAVTTQRVTQSLCIYTIWNEIIFQGY